MRGKIVRGGVEGKLVGEGGEEEPEPREDEEGPMEEGGGSEEKEAIVMAGEDIFGEAVANGGPMGVHTAVDELVAEGHAELLFVSFDILGEDDVFDDLVADGGVAADGVIGRAMEEKTLAVGGSEAGVVGVVDGVEGEIGEDGEVDERDDKAFAPC